MSSRIWRRSSACAPGGAESPVTVAVSVVEPSEFGVEVTVRPPSPDPGP